MAGKPFTKLELTKVLRSFKDGKISSDEIVKLFSMRGFKFSKATFRKYIQYGQLPRSERVGTKGRFTGSRGLYPAKIIVIINSTLKLLHDELFTNEEVQNKTSLPIQAALLTTQVSFTSVKERVEQFLDNGNWHGEFKAKKLADLVSSIEHQMKSLEELCEA